MKILVALVSILGSSCDLSGLTGGERGPWACLGRETPIEPVVVPYRVHLRRLVPPNPPLVGVPIKACDVFDAACTSPVDVPARTDETGRLDISLTSGFRGFLEIEAPPTQPDLVPGIIYALPVPDKSAPKNEIRTFSLPTKSELAALVGDIVSPDHGHVFVATLDCDEAPLAGVTVQAEPKAPETVAYYLDAVGTPSATQTKTFARMGGRLPSTM
ncbi:MAG: hypothetical protein KIT84_19390 [Labilithrix sp.]|nr:hypothetical protein [Labilithrix sp.]MCW5813200.1 hypothetical protein [Labilithrix sp.]